MKRYKHSKDKDRTDRVSFYIALSVCMMAVGVALWSAYASLNDYMDESSSSYFSSLSSDTAAVGKSLTGVTEAESTAPTDTPSAAATTTPTSAPATAAAKAPTQAPTGKRGFTIYENASDGPTEETALQSELSSLQAVLKVTDSLTYPVKSRSVLKQYSEDAVYNATMKDYRAHTGCDFAADEGESVYAMCAGTVENISVSELYGVIVEVKSGDFSVYYCGMDSELNVEKGDNLSAGDTIGTVGVIPSENADGAHIHIEVRSGDKLIDPLNVIDSNH